MKKKHFRHCITTIFVVSLQPKFSTKRKMCEISISSQAVVRANTRTMSYSQNGLCEDADCKHYDGKSITISINYLGRDISKSISLEQLQDFFKDAISYAEEL